MCMVRGNLKSLMNWLSSHRNTIGFIGTVTPGVSTSGDFFYPRRSQAPAQAPDIVWQVVRITPSHIFNKINLEYDFIRLIFVF
jgi:hypothetical protein